MTRKPAPCRIVAYIRVSTTGQGESGLGLEAQERAVAEYADRVGCAVVATFREVASGKQDDRPELAKALAHAKRIGARVVVAKLDRITRSAAFLLALVESGADVAFCDLPDLPVGPTGKFMLGLLAQFAELEAGLISQRTKDALASLKARGVLLGAARPECRNLSPEAAERGRRAGRAARRDEAVAAVADLAEDMKAWRAEGLTLQAIADRLNARKDTTANGAAWGPSQVKRTLDRLQPAEV